MLAQCTINTEVVLDKELPKQASIKTNFKWIGFKFHGKKYKRSLTYKKGLNLPVIKEMQINTRFHILLFKLRRCCSLSGICRPSCYLKSHVHRMPIIFSIRTFHPKLLMHVLMWYQTSLFLLLNSSLKARERE